MAYRSANWAWVQRAENAVFGVEWEWSPINFPAPSHVVDALLKMLGVQTGFGEPIHTGWPRSPDTAPPVVDEPRVVFTAPVLTRATLDKPAEWTVRLENFPLEPLPLHVELALASNDIGLHEQLVKQGDVYRTYAAPIRRHVPPLRLRATATFTGGSLTGSTGNQERQFDLHGTHKRLWLSDMSQIDFPAGTITLVDGTSSSGKVEGWNGISVQLGGGVTTFVEFNKTTRLDISPMDGPITKLDWRIRVFYSGGKIVKEVSGVLPVAEASVPSGTVTIGGSPHARPQKPWYRSELVWAIIVSGVRLVIGFTVSIVAGATLGLLMWRIEGVDKFIGPLFLGLQTLPSVCWVPLAVLVFGLNERGIMFVLVMGSFSAAALSLRDGLRTIPPLYPRAGLMLGAKNWKLYRYVLLPASLPALAGSLRTGFSFAWRSLMGAELVLTAIERRGLGFLLALGRDLGGIADVVAVMIVMVVIGILADRWVFAVLQQKVQARFGLK